MNRRVFSLASVLFLILTHDPLHAAGTSAEGRAIIRLVNFTKEGLVSKSYEGTAERAFYNEDEDCDEKEYRCFEPTLEKFRISVRPEQKRIVRFMQANEGKEMLIEYRKHRIEPVSLSSRMEVTNVFAQKGKPPSGFPDKKEGKVTGSKNYSVYGRVLRLEKRGLANKTWEGIYLDKTRRKVHPFSVSSEEMAKHLLETMKYTRLYHMGVTKALIGFNLRETKLDIFQVNYNEPARY